LTPDCLADQAHRLDPGERDHDHHREVGELCAIAAELEPKVEAGQITRRSLVPPLMTCGALAMRLGAS